MSDAKYLENHNNGINAGATLLPGQSLDDELAVMSHRPTGNGSLFHDDGHQHHEDWAIRSVGRAEEYEHEDRMVARHSSINSSRDAGKQLPKPALKKSATVATERMLEQAMQMDNRTGSFWDELRKTLGVQRFAHAARREQQRRASEDFRPLCPCLTRAVSSAWFEAFMGLIMIANGVLVGMEASYDSTPEGDQLESTFELLEHIFTGIFVLELGLRIFVFGWTWMCSVVNTLDTILIVCTGVLPMWILGPLGLKSGLFRVLQVLRILRLVRLIRMFRTFRFLRTGYKLTQGLFNSGTIIFHTYVMIMATLYVFAVFGVYLVGRSPSLDDNIEEQAAVKDLFKTVPAAMFTLFDFMTLNSWTAVVRPTQKYTSVLLVLSILVIMVMTLVLNNLITAVIVTHALGGLKEDTELVAAEKRQAEESDIKDLRRAFLYTDKYNPDLLTKAEFFAAMRVTYSDMRTTLGGMRISLSDAEEVWELLEAPSQGISEDDFCSGMRSMKGEALAKDSFAVSQHIRKINTRISRLSARLAGCKGEVDRLRTQTASARKDLGIALQEVHQFIQFAGMCVPLEGVKKIPKHMTTFQQKRMAWRCQ